jgi:hypothetical protein
MAAPSQLTQDLATAVDAITNAVSRNDGSSQRIILKEFQRIGVEIERIQAELEELKNPKDQETLKTPE